MTLATNSSYNSAAAPSESPAKSTYVSIGEEGYIDASKFVAVSKEAHDAFTKTLTTKDEIGFNQLYAQGFIFELSEKTKVLKIGGTIGLNEVRILEGVHLGEAVWVAYEFVVPE